MPLYVTGGKLQLGQPGQLAAQRACCCNEEGDDPGDCVCPNFCLYQVEITDPVQFGPRRTVPCGTFEDTPYGDVTKIVATSDFSVCFDKDQCCGPVTEPVQGLVGPILTTYTLIAQNNAGRVIYDSNLESRAAAYFEIFCEIDPETMLPRYKILVLFQVFVPTWNGLVPRFPYRHLFKYSIFDAPSQCIKKANATCDGGDSSKIRASYLDAPIVFTVTNDSAGLGEWDESNTSDTAEGDQSRVTPCFEHLRDNFTATFRITKRPSCNTVACNCSTNLAGLRATFDGKEFALGTAHTITEGNIRWQHEQDISGAYLFYKDTFLAEDIDCGIGEFSVPVELNTLELYCDIDSEADPPVQRWMVQATTYCLPKDVVDCEFIPLGYAQRLFNARIPCYEAESGCAGPPGGSYIPLGSPVDVVEAEGSPFLNGDLPDCGAPGFPSFRISQDCGS